MVTNTSIDRSVVYACGMVTICTEPGERHCPHCNRVVRWRTFYDHKKGFFKEETNTWKKKVKADTVVNASAAASASTTSVSIIREASSQVYIYVSIIIVCISINRSSESMHGVPCVAGKT